MAAGRRSLSAFSTGIDPPDDPHDGEHWLDTSSGIDYTWAVVSGYWVEGGACELFPTSPAPEVGDVFEHADEQWRWNGRGWAKPRELRVEGDAVVLAKRLVVPSITLGSDDDLGETLLAHSEALTSQGEAIDALETTIDGGTF